MNYSFYDEMDELDDILNESTDEEIFIESMEELFEEKATRDEYVMRRFKDKYKYDPKSGTIEVEGQRYKVVLPDKSGIEYIDNPTGFGPKQVASASVTRMDTINKNGALHLGPEFFALKDDKRRDAILKHELGHSKLHSTVAGYKYTDTSKISKEMVINEIDLCCRLRRDAINKMNDGKDSYITNDYIISIHENMRSNLSDYVKCSTASEMQSKVRADARKAANKYIPKNIDDGVDRTHANAMEFEADRYAANHSSERHLKRGLRDRNRIVSKPKNLERQLKKTAESNIRNQKAFEDEKVDPKTVKVSKSEVNKEYQNTNNPDGKSKKELQNSLVRGQHKIDTADYNARTKALKDKDLRNNSSLK